MASKFSGLEFDKVSIISGKERCTRRNIHGVCMEIVETTPMVNFYLRGQHVLKADIKHAAAAKAEAHRQGADVHQLSPFGETRAL